MGLCQHLEPAVQTLTVGLLLCRERFYAAPGVPLFVRAIAVVAWVTSLSIVGLVPVDVLDSLQGTSGSITGPLSILWSISYWYVGYTAGMKNVIADYDCIDCWNLNAAGPPRSSVGQWCQSLWDLLTLESSPLQAGTKADLNAYV